MKLSDGTVVPEQEENTTWTDGKSFVAFAETAEVRVEVVHADPEDS